ncbi:MAG: alpha-ketoglutarate-dependent dioxygenase AlkB [Chitinophagaceae bacterium]|nr:alpha-ketoglutarate-dependent dioxygenase AlkB [Chitinophagaceae bacterium]
MNLFETDNTPNLLPCDGVVHYFGKVYSHTEAYHFLQILTQTIDWKHDEVLMFGKRIITRRKAAWYGDQPFPYTYSKVTKVALPWTPELLLLKARAEVVTGETYNSCLLNLYHTGDEAMSWHSDDEKEIVPNSAIASFSFGAERKFSFRHKQTKHTASLLLEHGSLLVMKGETQTHWLHKLSPTKTVQTPRINLTFRKMIV